MEIRRSFLRQISFGISVIIKIFHSLEKRAIRNTIAFKNGQFQLCSFILLIISNSNLNRLCSKRKNSSTFSARFKINWWKLAINCFPTWYRADDPSSRFEIRRKVIENVWKVLMNSRCAEGKSMAGRNAPKRQRQSAMSEKYRERISKTPTLCSRFHLSKANND